MKKTLSLCLLLVSFKVFADITYYPESTIEKFNNPNTTSTELREEIFNLSDKAHIIVPGEHDTLMDHCPANTECMIQKTNLTYDQARKLMFGQLFLEQTSTNKYSLKEVYCNKTYDESAGIGPNKIPNPNLINCEHTWPQSKFSKAFPTDLQKTDLHHLFPVDMRANSTRNNNPFAEVNGKATNDTCRDSQIGMAINTSIKSFEPPKEHKGNVARAIYYFSTRYKMDIDPIQAKYLKIWNTEDPVDQDERERNDKIMKMQGNRNPFIDYPELIERL